MSFSEVEFCDASHTSVQGGRHNVAESGHNAAKRRGPDSAGISVTHSVKEKKQSSLGANEDGE